MVGQLGVVVLETAHRDAGAALYDGLAVDAEEHVHLHTVPQPAESNNQHLVQRQCKTSFSNLLYHCFHEIYDA